MSDPITTKNLTRVLEHLAAALAPATDEERADDEAAQLYSRVLPGASIVVYPMTFGKARLCLCAPDAYASIVDAWCYPTHKQAIEAAQAWDGEGDPLDGWTRNPASGRRRPDGDPDKEHRRW